MFSWEELRIYIYATFGFTEYNELNLSLQPLPAVQHWARADNTSLILGKLQPLKKQTSEQTNTLAAFPSSQLKGDFKK